MVKGDEDSDDESSFAPDLPRGITKEFIQRGPLDEFSRPTTYDEVTIHYVGYEGATDNEFVSSRNNESPLTFIVGKGIVIDGWEFAIKTMRPGEISRFTMGQEFLAIHEGMHPKNIPNDGTVVFELELVSFDRRRDLFKDGGCIKRVVREGQGGSKPTADGEVLMSLKTFSQERTLIEEREDLEYKIGSGSLGQLSKGVDKALRNMTKCGVVCLDCAPEYSYGEEHTGVIQVELTLKEVYVIQDVSWFQNRTLMKKRIVMGDDNGWPKETDEINLEVSAAHDGSEALAGFNGPTVLKFIWGDGEVAEVFEAATRKMSKHEQAILTCNVPKLCCEEKLGLASISAKQVVFKITLLDFNDEIFRMKTPDVESKLEFAFARKEVGGRLFKAQRWLMAFYRYEWVVKFLHESFQNARGVNTDKVEELRTACRLNQAACLLKHGDMQGVIRATTLVLDKHPSNVKALFRRATAQHARKEHMLAIQDLKELVQYEPQNAEARKLLQEARQAQRDIDANSKSMFAKMVTKGD